ncbi:MAG: hypothetical protein UR63_C0024G0013 [Candidatus Roizmanbacteria bacterium GW2011_GWC2_35_12]|uniref:Uncharacterized protein n=2 Tax=Candidatus Roizmaniibacteriota TaxID=1752723 RepID=A0A0G0BC98_9BACT|nr:MAG: hypothetical protein UR63_C0024G0013 [Candidatus Roizmanbacteria bacterium GW2011_GWC2_35_12]
MNRQIKINYKIFFRMKKKQSALKRFFSVFLPEAVYRNTKIEHPEISRKDVFSFLK